MRRRRLREVGLIGLTIFLVFTLFPLSSVNADTSIWFYTPYPQGEIGIATPEIGWRVFIGENYLEKAEFIINGKTYIPKYDLERNTFYVKLDFPLKEHIEVKARIKLKSYDWIEKSWSFAINKSSITELSIPNLTQQKAMDFANDYRYLMKLPLFEINPALNMSAQSHANYQYSIGRLTHYQESNFQAFIGESVKERAAYFGFNGFVAEDISFNTKPSIQKAVDDLFDAPYHRIPFLNPVFDQLGYGEKQYYSVLNFGSVLQPKEAIFVSYPNDGQLHVPVEWENFETPNPLRFYPNAPKKVGYPIMAGIYGGEIDSIKLIDAKMFNLSGQQIPVYINTPEIAVNNTIKPTPKIDDYLNQEIIIIPESPLVTDSIYKVEVSLQATDKSGSTKSYQKTWNFKTESKIGEGKKWLHEQVEYPSFQEGANSLRLFLGQRYIWLDQRVFPLDIAPFVINSRTMVPIRAIGNILGAEVDWNNEKRIVTYIKNETMIQIPIDANYVFVNNKKIPIDQGAVVKNGRSFVPLRFVSEQLGAEVEWNSSTQSIIVLLR